jgi:putative phosphoesterase
MLLVWSGRLSQVKHRAHAASCAQSVDRAQAREAAMRIGVISDTHGLLRPEAVTALNGSDVIIHAGDVGTPEVLEALRRIAPTFAVRGNVDTGIWADALPAAATIDAGGLAFHVVHRAEDIALDANRPDLAAVVFGHSHKPSIDWREGMLFCNPGSAGPRRFKLPVTIATFDVLKSEIRPQIVHLL